MYMRHAAFSHAGYMRWSAFDGCQAIDGGKPQSVYL